MSYPCPRCKGDTECHDTRVTKRKPGVRRRRTCGRCGEKFSTIEILLEDLHMFQQVSKNLALLKALLK